MTTNWSSPCARVSAKARKTAISRARRAQVFLEQRAALGVEPLAGRAKYLLGIASCFRSRIDARDLERRRPFPRRRVHMGGRVGGGQRYAVARPREPGGNAHGERRLADTAFAHGHDHARSARRDLFDQLIQRPAVRGNLRGGINRCRAWPSTRSHLSERIDADEAKRQQRDVDTRKAAKRCGHVLESGTSARLQGHGNGIVRVLRVEYPVENQPDVPNPDLVQLSARPFGLCE